MRRSIMLALLLFALDGSSSSKVEASEQKQSTRSLAQIYLIQANQHYLTGDLRSARIDYERALRIFDGAHDALGRAKCLSEIGRVDLELFRLEEAKRLFEEALEIRQKLLPAQHEDIAECHQNLANAAFASGDFDAARDHYRIAIEIGILALGENHSNIAAAKRSLGQLNEMEGRNSEAEVLYREALNILEKSEGRSHWKTAEARVVLAKHLAFEGDLDSARTELESGLEILEESLGPFHLSTTGAQLATCTVARLQGDRQRTAELVISIEAGIRRAIPLSHPLNAEFLHEAALVAQSFGKGREAESLLRKSMEIKDGAYGKDHPNSIRALKDLAVLLHATGSAQEASRLFEEVHLRAMRALPADSPEMARLLSDKSIYLFESGQIESALQSLERALRVQDSVIATLFAGASEREVRLLLDQHFLDLALSAHLRYSSQSVRSGRLAFETVLRRKGLGLDIALRGHRFLREQDPKHRELSATIRKLRDEQIRLWMGLPREITETGRVRRLEELRHEIDSKERLSRSELVLPPYRSLNITIDGVQAKLEAGQVLLEFVNYAVVESGYLLNPHRKPETRYAVGILRSQGEPSWVDLGPSSEIDNLAVAYRESLLSFRGDHRKLGRKLYDRTLGQLETLLRGAEKLEISPAGALQFVPMASLIYRDGIIEKFLIERYSINILPSGRDLLRQYEATTEWRSAVLIGGLDYGTSSGSGPTVVGGSSGFFGGSHFSRLPASGLEVEAIQGELGVGRGRILRGLAASEDKLDAIQGPTVLHFATHGFFQPEHSLEMLLRDSSFWLRTSEFVNPLLASGLALSNANGWRSARDADDGILTALEVRDLDLFSTQLAVLSACETGLGKSIYNQGVYGMRRALSIAGAKSQILTLWPVADETTKELMVSFYAQLKAGVDRTEALRNVQLAFAESEPLPITRVKPRGAEVLSGQRLSSHPYYWAGFVISGARGVLRIPTDAANGVSP